MRSIIPDTVIRPEYCGLKTQINTNYAKKVARQLFKFNGVENNSKTREKIEDRW